MKIKYGEIPDELFNNYVEFLIGKIYKILPMQENNDITLHKYMINLQKELIGNMELIQEYKKNSYFLSLLNKIEYMICNKCDNNECKTIVFDCIDIIKKMRWRDNGNN